MRSLAVLLVVASCLAPGWCAASKAVATEERVATEVFE